MIDNLVYAVGGSNRDDGTRSNLNSMERYCPERNEWEELPPMHRSRGAASVTALNGCLYAVGGYDSGRSCLCGGEPAALLHAKKIYVQHNLFCNSHPCNLMP